MVICLERGADLHMAQLMPLPLTVSCSSKIQIGFTFLVLAYPDCPGKEADKWLLLLLLLILSQVCVVIRSPYGHYLLRVHGRRHGVDWGGHVQSTPLLLQVAPEIDTYPTSFYRGDGVVGGQSGRLRLQTRYQTCQAVAGYGRHSHNSCSSRRTVCQQSAVARFLLQPPPSGTLYPTTFNLHHLFLPFAGS